MKKMEEDHKREVQELEVHKQSISVTLFVCFVFEHNHTTSGKKNSDWSAGGNCMHNPVLTINVDIEHGVKTWYCMSPICLRPLFYMC